MNIKFEGTIPGVAFSKHTFEGSPEGYVKFLKELEEVLDEVPGVFGINPQDSADVRTRLENANKAIVDIQKQFPDVKVYLNNK